MTSPSGDVEIVPGYWQRPVLAPRGAKPQPNKDEIEIHNGKSLIGRTGFDPWPRRSGAHYSASTFNEGDYMTVTHHKTRDAAKKELLKRVRQMGRMRAASGVEP